MKKTFAVLAAVVSVMGAAHAQSSVQVYGIIDLAMVKDKNATLRLDSGSDSSQLKTSRIGFKGTEDLGGGLKANFLLEGTVNIDNAASAGSMFNRQSYVGFSSDAFGEVRLGKVLSAYDDVNAQAFPGFDSMLSATNVWASTGYTANPNNTVYFASPSFGGVSATASYSLDEVKNVKGNIASANVKFEQGPLFAGAAYQVEQAPAGNNKYTRLNATYDLGPAKVLAGYGNAKLAGVKSNDYSIGADVPVGTALVASLGYASSKADVAGAKRASGVSLGAGYNLSKRTMAYAGYLSTKNSTTVPKNRLALGVKHTF